MSTNLERTRLGTLASMRRVIKTYQEGNEHAPEEEEGITRPRRKVGLLDSSSERSFGITVMRGLIEFEYQ